MAKKNSDWSATILEITAEDFSKAGYDFHSIPPDLREDIIDALKEHFNEVVDFRKAFQKIVNTVMEDCDEDFDDDCGGHDGDSLS